MKEFSDKDKQAFGPWMPVSKHLVSGHYLSSLELAVYLYLTRFDGEIFRRVDDLMRAFDESEKRVVDSLRRLCVLKLIRAERVGNGYRFTRLPPSEWRLTRREKKLDQKSKGVSVGLRVIKELRGNPIVEECLDLVPLQTQEGWWFKYDGDKEWLDACISTYWKHMREKPPVDLVQHLSNYLSENTSGRYGGMSSVKDLVKEIFHEKSTDNKHVLVSTLDLRGDEEEKTAGEKNEPSDISKPVERCVR